MDLVIRDVVGAVEDYDAVGIVVDVVVLDPAESGLDGKDTLWTRLVNQVVQDNCVSRIVSTVSNVSFVVLKNVIFLDVARGSVNKENTLAKIAENLVIQNFDLSLITSSNSGLSVWTDMVILLDPTEILFALNSNSIL